MCVTFHCRHSVHVAGEKRYKKHVNITIFMKKFFKFDGKYKLASKVVKLASKVDKFASNARNRRETAPTVCEKGTF
ncbi:hypothetical protein ABE28_015655 [Peribacillus muralis]|uniref:Uncharacterized protein n=1 Tax=Peribacillus muralis TaxID=264697 RepID=A0A1B3XRJ8_9BACI|nr:hypothetical protein [Peribacillus muralis]AOH55797.1 hypothetical protein ABE28_015655 [Peribacillus muralis]